MRGMTTYTRTLVATSEIEVGDRLPGGSNGFVVESFEPYVGVLGTGRVAIDRDGYGFTLLDGDHVWRLTRADA